MVSCVLLSNGVNPDQLHGVEPPHSPYLTANQVIECLTLSLSLSISLCLSNMNFGKMQSMAIASQTRPNDCNTTNTILYHYINACITSSLHINDPKPNKQYTITYQALPRNIRNRNTKFDKNVTKRGNVPRGKVEEHTDEFPVSKWLIGFFIFVVVGSTLVQFFNIFGGGKGLPPPPPPAEAE